jgi:hypothetical protein
MSASVVKRLLIIIPVVLVLTLVSLFMPARRVSIEGVGTLSFDTTVTLSVGSEVALAAPDIVFRSFGQSPGANSTTCVIVKPTGLTVGDLMIAQVVSKLPGTAVTAPGGWTQIRQDVSGTSVRSALFWKIATSSDTSATNFTFTTGKESNGGVITAWYGHDPTTPIDANNGQGNAASTTVTSPGIIPSVANCVLLMICGVGDRNTQSGYAIAIDNPAVWTERYDLQIDPGSKCALALGSATRPQTTATGNGTATTSASTANVGQLVAIRPAPPSNISNTPNSKAFGSVQPNSSYWSNGGSGPVWPLDNGECYFTVTNQGSSSVNISIKATDFSGGVGWTLASSPGVNFVTLKAGKSGDTNEAAMVTLTTSEQAFISNLGAGASKMWEIKLETGTFTDGTGKSSTITLTASAT